MKFLRIQSAERNPDRPDVARRMAIMDRPKRKDACQAACVANTSEGRYSKRHYTLKSNKSYFAYFFLGALATWCSDRRRNSLAPTRDGLENGSAFACDMRTWVARREAFQ